MPGGAATVPTRTAGGASPLPAGAGRRRATIPSAESAASRLTRGVGACSQSPPGRFRGHPVPAEPTSVAADHPPLDRYLEPVAIERLRLGRAVSLGTPSGVGRHHGRDLAAGERVDESRDERRLCGRWHAGDEAQRDTVSVLGRAEEDTAAPVAGSEGPRWRLTGGKKGERNCQGDDRPRFRPSPAHMAHVTSNPSRQTKAKTIRWGTRAHPTRAIADNARP